MSTKIKIILGIILIVLLITLGGLLVLTSNEPKNNKNQNSPQISAVNSNAEREENEKKFNLAYKDFQTTISNKDIPSEVKKPYMEKWLEINGFSVKKASIEEIQNQANWLENAKNTLLKEWNSFENSNTQKDAEGLVSEISNWNTEFSLNPDEKGDLDELKASLENLIKKTQNPGKDLEPEFKQNKEQLEALKKSKTELQQGLKKPEPVAVKKSVQENVQIQAKSQAQTQVQNPTLATSRSEEIVQKPVEAEIEVPKKPAKIIQQKPVEEKPIEEKLTPKIEEKPTQPVEKSSVCNGEYSCFVGNSAIGKVQHYVGQKLVWTSGNATFGRASAPTEKGLHRIYLKVRNYQLPSYPDYVSSYWIGFNPSGAGSAFHQYWDSSDNRLTIGCIKLPENDLAYIWKNSSVYQNSENPGTLVIII